MASLEHGCVELMAWRMVPDDGEDYVLDLPNSTYA